MKQKDWEVYCNEITEAEEIEEMEPVTWGEFKLFLWRLWETILSLWDPPSHRS